MFRAVPQLDLDVLDATRETALQAPARMRRELGSIARGPIAQQIIAKLSKEPPPPKRPIDWTSDRQRRFVMAKLRRENNIPYKRTHRQAQGWRVVLEDIQGGDGGVISVENSTPYADFVQGERQQRFLSQWPLARIVIRDEEDELQDATINAWYRVSGAIAA